MTGGAGKLSLVVLALGRFAIRVVGVFGIGIVRTVGETARFFLLLFSLDSLEISFEPVAFELGFSRLFEPPEGVELGFVFFALARITIDHKSGMRIGRLFSDSES